VRQNLAIISSSQHYFYRSVVIFTTQSACGHATKIIQDVADTPMSAFFVVLTSGCLSVGSLSWAKLGHYLVGSDHDDRSAFRSVIQLAPDDHCMAGF
jgi:hypothetical protein